MGITERQLHRARSLMACATRASLVIAVVTLTACGGDGPSSPAAPTGRTDEPASTSPIIVGVGGTPFGTGEQAVTLYGQNFQAGLSVIVSPAGGEPIEYSGARVRVESQSLATVLATLTKTGQHTAQVRNPGGTLSNAFGFQVQAGSSPPPAHGPMPSPPSPVPGPSPSPGPSPRTLPSIGAILPATPTTGPTDQRLAVSGSGFEAGLIVTVSVPNGGSTTVGGGQIQNVSSTGFEMLITLRDPGLYGLRVTNPDGSASTAFVFAASAPVVSIASVQPQNPLVSAVDQRIIVNGGNFQRDLTVNVRLPGGGTRTLSGSQIQNVSTSRFELLITLPDPGTYAVRVTNPDGGQSNAFAFTASVAALTITSISPPNPVSGPTDQRIVVNGAAFQTGMIVTLARAGGVTITLSSGQIQNVTSSRFEMLVALRDPGSYTLRVTNPEGQSVLFLFFAR